jgi:hypothetical protein
MIRKLGMLAAVAATALMVVSSATAAPRTTQSTQGTKAGVRCVIAGVTFLTQNNLLSAAAQRKIDYDAIDSDTGNGEGAINTDLPAGSFLSLGTVIRLHFTNPELFDWCN